ncbi:MAG: hypothetical protein IPL52_08650 [Flavobacteriales bacterium]|nr:hypothetical protein [Flavobacteriales bacterium]
MAAPTPQAGELCLNRDIHVYERKTYMHAWLERKVRTKKWRTPAVILLPTRRRPILWPFCSKKRIYKDSVVGNWLDTLRTAVIIDPARVKRAKDDIVKRFWNDDGLWERYVMDTVSQPGVMAIVKRSKYYGKLTSRRLRHHVLSSRRAMVAMGKGRAKNGAVKRANIKFEDGVIDEIVVVADVKVPNDQDERDTTRAAPTHTIEVTFTNSNTPIPFSNVWNYYGKFMNRVPLYGYRTQDGQPFFRGTDGVDYTILLSDVLRYIPELHLGSNNSAPGDTVVRLDFRNLVQRQGGSIDSLDRRNEPDRLCGMLLKDNIRKYGELKVYTDLVGIAKNEPNGLLQSEYSWRLPLWPKRNQGLNPITTVEPYFGIVLRDKEESRLYVGLDSARTSTAPPRGPATGPGDQCAVQYRHQAQSGAVEHALPQIGDRTERLRLLHAHPTARYVALLHQRFHLHHHQRGGHSGQPARPRTLPTPLRTTASQRRATTSGAWARSPTALRSAGASSPTAASGSTPTAGWRISHCPMVSSALRPTAGSSGRTGT